MSLNSSFSIPLPILICVVVFLLYVVANIYPRHYSIEGDEQLYKALHIKLPGYASTYYPEHTIELQNHVGFQPDGWVIVDTADSTENSEIIVGKVLLGTGFYDDHKIIKKDNGHYILYRPEGIRKFFTLHTYYRIWWGKAVS